MLHDPRPEEANTPPGHPSAGTFPPAMKALIQFTERFGTMLSRGLLTVLYFGVLGPFAVFYRLLADPLHLKPQKQTNWVAWPQRSDTLRAARKQD